MLEIAKYQGGSECSSPGRGYLMHVPIQNDNIRCCESICGTNPLHNWGHKNVPIISLRGVRTFHHTPTIYHQWERFLTKSHEGLYIYIYCNEKAIFATQ